MGKYMSLLESIKADQLTARKNKEAFKASLLTTLIGEAAMIGKNAGRDTTDTEVIATIRKFLKGIDETLQSGFVQAAKYVELHDEKEVLEYYLPRQMDKSELKRVLIQGFGDAIRTESKGVLMKFLKEKFAGQYDGKLAAQVVDEFLQ